MLIIILFNILDTTQQSQILQIGNVSFKEL